jgi:hypothetical protein
MARFTTTAVSSRPQADVFDYLADMRNASDWDPGVDGATLIAPGETGGVSLGATFDVTLNLAGRLRHVEYRVAEYDRPWRVVLDGTDPAFSSLDTVTVELSVDGGTAVTYAAVLKPRGMWQITAPLIAVVFARIGRRAGTGLARELLR